MEFSRLFFSFVFNCLVYSGSRMIAGGWYHHNIETAVDRSLPFVPQFLIIYFGCYLFWIVNYILIAGRIDTVCTSFLQEILYQDVSAWFLSFVSHNEY